MFYHRPLSSIDNISLRKLRNRQMVGAIDNCNPLWVSQTQGFSLRASNSNPRICFPRKFPNPNLSELYHAKFFSLLSTFPVLRLSPEKHSESLFSLPLKASSSPASVESEEFIEEPGTSVKFQTSLVLPGYSSPLCLLGTGYREKVFAIIGVKVYAAGLYVNPSILDELKARKGLPTAEVQDDSSLFKSIFQSPSAKSLKIVLVREVDGKTFWDALDNAVSPRIKAPTPTDSSALSTFRKIFEGRPLKKGTFIFLTWIEPSKMLVSVSGEGPPVGVDATIESRNVSFALFDVFFGETPVSPTLKASVADGLAKNII